MLAGAAKSLSLESVQMHLPSCGWKLPSAPSLSMCVYVLVAQSGPTLCNSTDCSPPGSAVHGILQARILEWVALPSSRRSSRPRGRICVPCLCRRFFTTSPTRKGPRCPCQQPPNRCSLLGFECGIPLIPICNITRQFVVA